MTAERHQESFAASFVRVGSLMGLGPVGGGVWFAPPVGRGGRGGRVGRGASGLSPGYPLVAPSVPPRVKCRWKAKNTRATGMVMSRVAASLIGYWLPWPSWPETSEATPVVRVFRSGLWRDTMKCGSSFHDAWNDRMVRVMRAGRAMGSTMDQKVRKVL